MQTKIKQNPLLWLLLLLTAWACLAAPQWGQKTASGQNSWPETASSEMTGWEAAPRLGFGGLVENWASGALVAAKTAIGATGKVGEDALKLMGGESQVYFRTSQGGRYVDQLVGDIANESKVGYQSLTPTIRLQISKDAELLNGGTFDAVNWHFFESPVTGVGGPSQPLLNSLQQNGINVIIH